MRNLKLFLTGILCVFTISNAQTQKLKVSNLYHSGASPKGTVYALPLTVISINFEITRTIYKQGPYAEFASEYLGITDAPQSDSTYSEITGIHIEDYSEVDPGQYYLIDSKPNEINESEFTQLIKAGLVIDASGFRSHHGEISLSDHKTLNGDLSYKDLSYEKFVTLKVDTFYKKVQVDSTYRRVPVLKKQLEKATIEEKAEEAANLIFKTRERRMKLVAGEFDFIPDGQSLQISIDELDKIEDDYLSLFYGRTFKEVKSYRYEITPLSNLSQEQDTVCYFSSGTGISDTKSPGMKPIILKIANKQFNAIPAKAEHNMPGMAEFSDHIIYRLPNRADLYVFLDHIKLMYNVIFIDQYGIFVGL